MPAYTWVPFFLNTKSHFYDRRLRCRKHQACSMREEWWIEGSIDEESRSEGTTAGRPLITLSKKKITRSKNLMILLILPLGFGLSYLPFIGIGGSFESLYAGLFQSFLLSMGTICLYFFLFYGDKDGRAPILFVVVISAVLAFVITIIYFLIWINARYG